MYLLLLLNVLAENTDNAENNLKQSKGAAEKHRVIFIVLSLSKKFQRILCIPREKITSIILAENTDNTEKLYHRAKEQQRNTELFSLCFHSAKNFSDFSVFSEKKYSLAKRLTASNLTLSPKI